MLLMIFFFSGLCSILPVRSRTPGSLYHLVHHSTTGPHIRNPPASNELLATPSVLVGEMEDTLK